MPQRTYWHLEDQRRVPSEYEIVSSRLQYARAGQFEVELPLAQWFDRFLTGSPLKCTDWERFVDPRRTTYATYTELQTAREVFVDGLLDGIEGSEYDQGLRPEWVRTLGRFLAPARYPLHALQMVTAYIGQLAPSGRITLVALFQAADEMRRIQRIAYRQQQLRLSHEHFGDDSKDIWQRDAAWQPLRETIERLLVAYDWGETLVGLNLVVKPVLDELLLGWFADQALDHADHVLQQILRSLAQDAEWQRQWTQELVRVLIDDTPANAAVIQTWIGVWRPRALNAARCLAFVVDGGDEPAASRVETALDHHFASCGIERG